MAPRDTGRLLQVSVLDGDLAVCRLPADAPIPAWATRAGPFCVMRTAEELSVVCPAGEVPSQASPSAGNLRVEGGWRALRLHGPFAFGETGVLSSVLAPLADAGVSIFALSTFDTDYVLVKSQQLDSAVAALRAAGHATLL